MYNDFEIVGAVVRILYGSGSGGVGDLFTVNKLSVETGKARVYKNGAAIYPIG